MTDRAQEQLSVQAELRRDVPPASREISPLGSLPRFPPDAPLPGEVQVLHPNALEAVVVHVDGAKEATGRGREPFSDFASYPASVCSSVGAADGSHQHLAL